MNREFQRGRNNRLNLFPLSVLSRDNKCARAFLCRSRLQEQARAGRKRPRKSYLLGCLRIGMWDDRHNVMYSIHVNPYADGVTHRGTFLFVFFSPFRNVYRLIFIDIARFHGYWFYCLYVWKCLKRFRWESLINKL